MAGHSRFAPSATEREYQCPPSFLLNEQLPDRQSFDAAHGTAAHHLGELCLRNDHDTVFYAGCSIAVTETGDCRFVHENAPLIDGEQAFEVDDEMVNAVQSYIDMCREVEGDHFYEVRVEHTRWCPDFDEWGDPLGPQFGTSDHVCVAAAEKTIYIDDLKYGKGVQVFADHNKQATKYALGTIDEKTWEYGITDDWKVVIRIAQPRLDHFDVWETTVGELFVFGKQIKERLSLVFVEGVPFNPGEKQCKFCKAAGRCKPLHDYVHDQRALSFEDEDAKEFKSPHLLDLEELAQAYLRHPLFVLQYDAIVREIQDALKEGIEVPGLKLVNAKTHRQWTDQVLARAKLRELGVPREKMVKEKFVSPNQAEKLLVKEHRPQLESLWRRPPGGPVIALADDPREPYTAQQSELEGFVDEDFDDGFN